ncbi:hypothetical protein [Pseudonocardia sp.]|uniref:hypothetical protein n=1 Tax=Pseudonocardia sp. TaxID=60912 RepID=UPI003D0AE8AF
MPGIDVAIGKAFDTILASIMKALWTAALYLLRTALDLVDGALAADAASSPLAALGGTLMWVACLVALGLFCWQLGVTVLRGGVGFWRIATGPLAFGVACALSVGVVTVALGGADGLTRLLLQEGAGVTGFRGLLDSGPLGQVLTETPDLGSDVDATARSVVLGIVSAFAIVPAAIGFLLQAVFRQVVVLVLVATLPLTAAGLMTRSTTAWLWRALRWTAAAVLLKPALALVLVAGTAMLGEPVGLGGLLAAAGVLLVALLCPFGVFRLLAFVEPGTASGVVLRAGAARTSPEPDEVLAAGTAAENSHTARFDGAAAVPSTPYTERPPSVRPERPVLRDVLVADVRSAR